MSRWWWTSAAVVAVLAGGVDGATASPTGAPAAPSAAPVSWQAAGDSYSSGEGVFGNVGACAQSPDAYGPVAVIELGLRQWEISSTFTACTGHLMEDFFIGRGDEGSLWDWGREQGGPERVDVITMSFGGNDIGFGDVVKDCLRAVPDSWSELLLGDSSDAAEQFDGCDVSEEELRSRADALLDPTESCSGTRSSGSAGFRCDLNLGKRRGSIIDAYYDIVTDRLTDRGVLIVVGYPALFAPVDQWPGWVKSTCQGVSRGDTEMLGRGAEYLNNKLQEAVSRANEALGSERVVFIDRYASYRDGLHELCGTNDDWLNGLSTTRGTGLTFRLDTSFHPNRAGHADTARQVVDALEARLDRWRKSTASPMPSDAGRGISYEAGRVVALDRHANVSADKYESFDAVVASLAQSTELRTTVSDAYDDLGNTWDLRCNNGYGVIPVSANVVAVRAPDDDYVGTYVAYFAEEDLAAAYYYDIQATLTSISEGDNCILGNSWGFHLLFDQGEPTVVVEEGVEVQFGADMTITVPEPAQGVSTFVTTARLDSNLVVVSDRFALQDTVAAALLAAARN